MTETKNKTILSTQDIPLTAQEQIRTIGFDLLIHAFIQTTPIHFEATQPFDIAIVTSKNGATSVINHYNTPFVQPIFCVGAQTAQLLTQKGFQVSQIAHSANQLAQIITTYFPHNSYAHFAGNLARTEIQQQLKANQININTIVVYQTQLTPIHITTPLQAILFYSPSAVQSYLQLNTITTEQCYCIGKTTAQSLKNHTNQVYYPSEPKINNLVTLLKNTITL